MAPEPETSFSSAHRPVASNASNQPASTSGTLAGGVRRKVSTTSATPGGSASVGRSGQINAVVSAKSPTKS